MSRQNTNDFLCFYFDALIWNGFNVDIVVSDGILMFSTHTAYDEDASETDHEGDDAGVNNNKTGEEKQFSCFI